MKFPLRLKTAVAALALVGLALLPAMPNAQAAETKGCYTVAGLGPAGLDLITARAIKVIQEADIVFCSAKTKKMLTPKVDFSGKQVLEGYNYIAPYFGRPCPPGAPPIMGKTCEQYHQIQQEFMAMVRKAVSQGKKVVLTADGDPAIYGPGFWSMQPLADINPRLVAGLSSFNAASAALKAGLSQTIITTPYFKERNDTDTLESLAVHDRATMILFMLWDEDKLMTKLAKAYPADTPVGVVVNAGSTADQKVVVGTVGDIKDKIKGLDLGRALMYVGKALSPQYTPAGKAKSKGKYYLVGVGPGDPDLATLRALDVIKQADIVFARGRIQASFAKELAGKKVMEYYRSGPPSAGPNSSKGEQPVERRKKISAEQRNKMRAEFLSEVRKAVAQGKTVAVLTSGDPLLFSPFAWSLAELKDIETEVVPGVSCFNAANAALGANITMGKNTHSVLLASRRSLEEMARHKATLVLFTMHTDFKDVIASLGKHYSPDTPAAIVSKAGYAQDEKAILGTLGNITQKVGDQRLSPYLLYVGDALTNKTVF